MCPPSAATETDAADAPAAETNTLAERDRPATANANPNTTTNANLSAAGSSEEGERAHSNEPERVIEMSGPNNRYGRMNVILGKGAYKVVWKAIDKEEGIETTRTEFNEFSEEVEILKKVRHPNIITFHDSWYANGEFVFITELMTSGTLREYTKKLRNPSIKIIRRWARQLLKGLAYLHSHSPPIIHRDIKCDNIFINGSHGEVKIGDMGTAKMRFGKKYTVIGTPEFMAPEMYEEKGYNEKVDIYAFGMCLLEMVTGEYPYSECKNAAQIYKKVSQGIKPDCLAKVQEKDILSMINNCLSPEHERWSAKRLAEHPFLLEEPEVMLMSATENKTRLKLQVLFKGHEKHTIKFEYNRDTDTAEDVVQEMIDEKVLAAKYQGLVCHEIHRILRELSKTTPSEKHPPSQNQIHAQNNTAMSMSMSPTENTTYSSNPASASGSHRRLPSELDVPGHAAKTTHSRPIEPDAEVGDKSPRFATFSARRNSITNMEMRAPEGVDPAEFVHKDYANDCPIDEFILDVASLVHRPAEKANEWLSKLKSEDILTVGDLRDLHEEDWTRLNLTVFAARAIKNSLYCKNKLAGLESLSPRVSSKLPDPHF